MLREVDGDLRPGVTRPHDEYVAALEMSAIAVVGSVQNRPGEVPGPVGKRSGVVVAGRDDDGRGREGAGCGVHNPVTGFRAIDALDGDPGAYVYSVVRRILIEVADDAISRDPRPLLPTDAVARQVGEPSHGVEVQSVVVASPTRPDLLGTLQHDDALTAAAQLCRDGEPGRARPDDDRAHAVSPADTVVGVGSPRRAGPLRRRMRRENH